jgi:hypothetical protein
MYRTGDARRRDAAVMRLPRGVVVEWELRSAVLEVSVGVILWIVSE